MSLGAALLAHLNTHTDRSAVELLDRRGEPVSTWSRAELAREVGRWQRIFSRAGLAVGDRIGLGVGRDVQAAALHTAAHACGLVVVPVNTALSPVETARLVASARLAYVATTAEFASRVRGMVGDASASWVTIDEMLEGTQPCEPQAPVSRRGTDDALVIFTSGTTGEPKAVPLSDAGLVANLAALAQAWNQQTGDRLLHMLPLHHYHGLVLALYGTLRLGGTIVLLERFDARVALSVARSRGIDVVMGVPTMYRRMCDAAEGDAPLTSVRLATSGSAPLGTQLWQRVRERLGVALIERYGLTETGIATTNPIDRPCGGSVGLPLANTRVSIHANGRYTEHEAATRSPRGEVCIAGPTVTRGYENAPDANRKAFRDGWFHSGDLGYFDTDGYLWIDGRMKDLIIVGGSNVLPGEVERPLAGVPGVEEICVVGLPDADLGEIVAAFVVAGPGVDALELEARLRRTAAETLAAYKRPRRYLFVDALPVNAMGKVDRAALRARGRD